MSNSEIREPIQKRSIEKKEKIIEAGFNLICKNGFHNTNTAEIAKAAGVSTGIVYQYFTDKFDIFICGLEKYGDTVFYSLPHFPDAKFEKKNLAIVTEEIIDSYIENHKLSEAAHQEITAMIHSNKQVGDYFFKRELEITYKIADFLKANNYDEKYLIEKTHIIVGMVDTLCHEIAYHKHDGIDYDAMKKIVINNIVRLLND